MSKNICAFSGLLIGQLVGVLFLVSLVVAENSPKVLQITPAGEVKSSPPISQIVIQFDSPVVPLGRMERESREIPITIRPAVECQWRWIDRSNLSCQISTLKPLTSGVTYSVTVPKLDVSSDSEVVDSAAFRNEFASTFTVDRPGISVVQFSKYVSPTKPVYEIQGNIPLDRHSIEEHVYFVDSDQVRHPVRAEELERSPYEYEDYVDTDFKPGIWWRIMPARDLSALKEFQLKSEKGIRSRSGEAVSLKGRSLGKGATFGEFSLIGIECYRSPSGESEVTDGEEDEATSLIHFSANNPVSLSKDAGACDPLSPIAVQFSAPVTTAALRKALKISPDPYPQEMDQAWEQMPANEEFYEPHRLDRAYSVQIPGPLKAERGYTVQLAAPNLQDSFERSLSSDGEVAFVIGERRARIVAPPTYSTLESQIETFPPLYLTNIRSLIFNYQALEGTGKRSEGTFKLEPFTVRNLSYRFPLPAGQILNGGSGLLSGTLESPEYRSPQERESFFVQRTPFAVHVKLSLYDTMVWVTDFQTGEIVADATVEILRGQVWDLLKNARMLARSRTDASGIASLPGLEQFDPQLTDYYQWDRNHPKLVVRVTKGDSIAAVPADYDFRVDTGIYPILQKRYDTIRAWGTTAQGIYRAGDTIQFKLFLRDAAKERFTLPPAAKYTLEVQDSLGKRVFQQTGIEFSALGTWSGSLPLAQSAAVGWYTFSLQSSLSTKSWVPMRVLVSDFTPAPFRVSVETDQPAAYLERALNIRTRAAFHAGGAYGDAKGRLSITMQPSPPEFSQPAIADFVFTDGHSSQREVLRQEFVLSKSGEQSAEFRPEDKSIAFAKLRIEGAVADERGKTIAGFSSLPYWGRDRFVGVHVDSWIFEKGKESPVELIVVDARGDVVPDAKVSLRIERDQISVAQVKSAGNAFLPDYQVEQVVVSEQELTSGTAATIVHFIPQEIGAHRIIATITDSAGNQHSSQVERWVIGSGEAVWRMNADEQIKLTPERESYAVGEEAKFLLQNPFPGAQALITVERDGVISRRVERLADAATLIKVPIEPSFAPGFFLSVVVVSPRVAAPLEKGVDLGKPAYRVGYARVNVPRSQEKIQIQVEPARKMYQPGEEVVLSLTASDFAGKAQRGELAVTVLDQAVFDLIRDGSSLYDIYSAFYQLDSLGVANFNILRQLIGRQNFERKGMAEAGDGGRGAELRSIDSFVAYWNPAVTLGADGKATVKFRAPGNLTGWKVFAIAVDRGSRMGTGSGEFAVSKNLEIRPINPQIVRIGDTLNVRFSVMNRSQHGLSTDIAVKASGSAQGEQRLSSRLIQPGERETVQLELKPTQLSPIDIEVTASSGSDRDGFKTSIPVLPIASTERVMQTVAINTAEERVKLKIPAELKPGEGKMHVALFPTLVGDMSSSFSYLKEYPYSCWEQRLSKAMMAAWFIKGGNNLPESFSWKEAEHYVSDLFKQAADFQGENGGMAYFKPDPESIDPYLSTYTGLVFEWLRGLGYQPPQAVTEKLYTYLQELLKRDPPALSFYDAHSLLKVRVMALRVLAGAHLAEVEQVKRVIVDAERLDIFTRAILFDTCTMLGMKEEATVQRLAIQSQSNQTADAIEFNDSSDPSEFRLLSSAVRGSCMVLDAIVRNKQVDQVSQDWVQKVVRGIVKQRAASDRWQSTQENVFCINALRSFIASEGDFNGPLEISAAVESGVFARARFTRPLDLVQTFQRDILPSEIGIERELIMRKSGNRRGYATVGLEFPVTRSGKEVNSGIEVYREFSIKDGKNWRVIGDQMALKLGDVVRVDLYVNAPGARTFVVLDDRLAGTFEVLNKQLATTSLSAGSDSTWVIPEGSRFAGDESFRGFGYGGWGFSHTEQRKDSVRFYAEYLEPGKYHLTHLIQVVAPGSFTAPAAHSEEMYVPAIYGESSPGTVSVPLER